MLVEFLEFVIKKEFSSFSSSYVPTVSLVTGDIQVNTANSPGDLHRKLSDHQEDPQQTSL